MTQTAVVAVSATKNGSRIPIKESVRLLLRPLRMIAFPFFCSNWSSSGSERDASRPHAVINFPINTSVRLRLRLRAFMRQAGSRCCWVTGTTGTVVAV